MTYCLVCPTVWHLHKQKIPSKQISQLWAYNWPEPENHHHSKALIRPSTVPLKIIRIHLKLLLSVLNPIKRSVFISVPNSSKGIGGTCAYAALGRDYRCRQCGPKLIFLTFEDKPRWTSKWMPALFKTNSLPLENTQTGDPVLLVNGKYGFVSVK